MVYMLDDEELWFPAPGQGEKSGLMAVGGDLRPERLILAYSHGIFPWFSFRDWDMPAWYCPMKRFVIFPEEIHVSHSMRTLINSGKYRCTADRDFAGVIRGCSLAQGRIDLDGAWLGPDMIAAYTALYEMGAAHSVEVWEAESGALVGGLYGVQLGAGFFGESMFSLRPSASKLALIYLARLAGANGWKLIDCQFETPHLRSMGGREIDYGEYMDIIREEKE